MKNALTVDVEEYFHPAELQALVDSSAWGALPARVEFQVERILDLFDGRQVRATFFILGWVAEHHPSVVRRIAARGHEIACHSFSHQLVYEMTPQAFAEDTRRAVKSIEDACGVTPTAYRAPSYSITRDSFWALEVLVECGFTCDSSIYPIRHDRYGIPGFSRHPVTIRTPSGLIHEVPAATVLLAGGQVSPIGGGGYLRLLPYRYTAAGIRRVNHQESRPVCIYFHPWEIDPEQPRLASKLVSRVRTYSGLATMYGKIDRLLSEFRFCTMAEVYSTAAAAASAG